MKNYALLGKILMHTLRDPEGFTELKAHKLFDTTP